MPGGLAVTLLLLGLSQISAQAPEALPQVKVLAPSGEVEVVDGDSSLEYLEAPSLAPSPSATVNDTQADCITSADIFWGSDFLSTRQETTTSANDCCKMCKEAIDCTVWNWCSKEEGCTLPPNLAAAMNQSTFSQNTCIWKPRPVTFAGTLPLPPEANVSSAMKGWISGIPINGTLIPKLDGFQLYTGVEMDYSVENDFYCQGSTTTKPICQLYGNAKGGAAACLNNPVCRGYQICWTFPVWSQGSKTSAIIRMKGGLGPLNMSSALQNPYCSIYTVDNDVLGNTTEGYALRNAYNGTAAEAYYQYAVAHPNDTAASNAVLASWATAGVSSSSTGSSTQQGGNNRRLLQSSSPTPSTVIEAGGNFQSTPVTVTGNSTAVISPSQANAIFSNTSAVVKPLTPAIAGTNFTTPFLDGTTLQAFNNVTFNYSQCFANAPTVQVTIQSQLFPLLGPQPLYSIHTWTEKPFRSSATVCCAVQAVNDIFLNLQTGVIATSPLTYVASNINLTNAGPLRNYDTVPSSIASPVVYIPAGQLNSPGGSGRQYNFPRINSTDYINALERLHFSLSQIALGDQLCSYGFPQLASALDFVGGLLGSYDEEEGESESPGGIPADITYLNASSEVEAGGPPMGCLIESGVEFDGDKLQTLTGNQTLESCCSACWLYSDAQADVSCDVWILDTQSQSCELRNNTAAANFRAVEVLREDSTSNLISGRLTGIQPGNSTAVFSQSL